MILGKTWTHDLYYNLWVNSRQTVFLKTLTLNQLHSIITTLLPGAVENAGWNYVEE